MAKLCVLFLFSEIPDKPTTLGPATAVQSHSLLMTWGQPGSSEVHKQHIYGFPIAWGLCSVFRNQELLNSKWGSWDSRHFHRTTVVNLNRGGAEQPTWTTLKHSLWMINGYTAAIPIAILNAPPHVSLRPVLLWENSIVGELKETWLLTNSWELNVLSHNVGDISKALKWFWDHPCICDLNHLGNANGDSSSFFRHLVIILASSSNRLAWLCKYITRW